MHTHTHHAKFAERNHFRNKTMDRTIYTTIYSYVRFDALKYSLAFVLIFIFRLPTFTFVNRNVKVLHIHSIHCCYCCCCCIGLKWIEMEHENHILLSTIAFNFIHIHTIIDDQTFEQKTNIPYFCLLMTFNGGIFFFH